MPGRALPNLGLKGFFTSGEAGWGADVDTNFLRLSVLTQGIAVAKVSTTPSSPTEGQVYIFNHTHATQPNKVAVFDNGAWVYLTPSAGWVLYNIAGAIHLMFNGTKWVYYYWKATVPVAADFSTVRLGTGFTPVPTIVNSSKGTGVEMTFWRNSTASNWRQAYLLKQAPVDGGGLAVPYRFEAKYCHPWGSNNNFAEMGIAVTSSGGSDTAKHLRVGDYQDTNKFFPNTWKNTGLNTVETVWTTNGLTPNAAGMLVTQNEYWAAIEYDGTNLIGYASLDGYSWWAVSSEPKTFFTSSNPDLIGFGWEAVAADGGISFITCPHFKVTTDLSEPFGLNLA